MKLKTIMNDAGRELPLQISEFGRVEPYLREHKPIQRKYEARQKTFVYNKIESKLILDLKEALVNCGIKDGMTISFHHHLRDGDYVINMVMKEIALMGIKNLTLAASSLQKIHEPLIEYIKQGVISHIYTSGMRGRLAQEISYNNILRRPVVFQTHGGRVRAIETGKINIDIAFIGAPVCDEMGNMNGRIGQSAFGSMGYAMVDAIYAEKVVAVTDNLVPYPLNNPSINQTMVDYVVVTDKIGEPDKIASGSTRITQNDLELKIAKYAADVLIASGYIRQNFSFQAGSGGASLAVIRFIKQYMKDNNIIGGFVSGGVTAVLAELLAEGYFKALLDVQTFDKDAAVSLNENVNHIEMSASMYANPYSKGCVTNMLDVVVLSATEVDIDFNVNVLTGSDGVIMGAQGGHPDTAEGAKLRVVTAPIIRKGIPIIRDSVTTVVTPGCDVDVVVTDIGIAVNPLRQDILNRLKDSDLPLKSITELKDAAYSFAGAPETPIWGDEIVGVVEARDGTVMDVIRNVIKM